MKRSTVVGNEDNVESQVRTSYGVYLGREETAIAECLEKRAASVAQVPSGNVEPLQVRNTTTDCPFMKM
jgi:NADH:ubiquinone oxidoreductase subunit F (NADH-binding)